MLQLLFTWLDRFPLIYWGLAVLTAFILVGWIGVGLQVKNIDRRPSLAPGFGSGLVLLLMLLAWRWPFLFSATEYNPDESQFLAGSITLTRDPIFWRAVDGTTSGPLNFYALLPIHWLGAPIDYFTARLEGLLLVWIALLACYTALKIQYGIFAARMGVLPTVAFFSFVHEWDYIHYSSEHVPLALFAVAVCFLILSTKPLKQAKLWFYTGGFVAGLMPWAKLQAGPLGLAVIVWGCWLGFHFATPERYRRVGLFILSAGLPSLLFLLAVGVMGQTDTFVQNYFVQNIQYIGGGGALTADLIELWDRASETHLLSIFLMAQIISLALSAVCLVRRRRLPDFIWIGGALCSIVAIICVLIPGRGFLHYTLFVVMPFTLWGGAAISCLLADSRVSKFRWIPVALLGVVGGLLPLGARLQQPKPDMIGRLAMDWRYPRTPLGNVLKSCAKAGDQLAIWGWYARLHVESGLPQATRVGYTYWSIEPSPMRDYHRKIFLQDLIKNQPAFFVDAVGPQSYYFQNRITEGHEVVPGLDDYIQEKYSLIIDFGCSRFYVRRDQLGRSSLAVASLKRAVAAGRGEASPVGFFEEPPAEEGLAHKIIDGQNVTMMLPPAKLTWALQGMDQEFVFEYGYDPVAYRDVTQGNGTELTVSLCTPDRVSKILFHRLLDPAHVPSDRGLQNAHVVLPPFPSGTSLVVETGPGPYNDNSWDWAYFTRGRFRRYPYYALRGPAGENFQN